MSRHYPPHEILWRKNRSGVFIEKLFTLRRVRGEYLALKREWICSPEQFHSLLQGNAPKIITYFYYPISLSLSAF
jgi:hypothetical protein